MSNDFSRFLAIREAYAKVLPAWTEEHARTGNMQFDPYIYDFTLGFTPIESATWGEIRGAGLPFYPQFPVLNYFLDFACPFLKIGIECDGAAWHDEARDKVRDERLARAGWTIFRVPGHECKRIIERPTYRQGSEDELANARDWFSKTVDGLIHVIGHAYFDRYAFSIPSSALSEARMALLRHCSTGCVDFLVKLDGEK